MMNTMTQHDLQHLKILLNDSKEDAFLFAKSKFQIRSKKKRIRKKFCKKISAQLAEMEKSLQSEEESSVGVHQEIDFSTLPITFILELGREYFNELDVVKSYYTKSKEEYYKNKALLFKEMNEAIHAESAAVRNEVIEKIAARQK